MAEAGVNGVGRYTKERRKEKKHVVPSLHVRHSLGGGNDKPCADASNGIESLGGPRTSLETARVLRGAFSTRRWGHYGVESNMVLSCGSGPKHQRYNPLVKNGTDPELNELLLYLSLYTDSRRPCHRRSPPRTHPCRCSVAARHSSKTDREP